MSSPARTRRTFHTKDRPWIFTPGEAIWVSEGSYLSIWAHSKGFKTIYPTFQQMSRPPGRTIGLGPRTKGCGLQECHPSEGRAPHARNGMPGFYEHVLPVRPPCLGTPTLGGNRSPGPPRGASVSVRPVFAGAQSAPLLENHPPR